MSHPLPRHIADLVGIVFNEPKRQHKPSQPDNRTKSPIYLVQNSDGTMTLMRFRKTVGWIAPVHLAGDRNGYTATSVHGEIKNCYSLRHAQTYLLSHFH